MNEPTDSLNLTIKQLARDLRLLEKRLRVEPDPSADAGGLIPMYFSEL